MACTLEHYDINFNLITIFAILIIITITIIIILVLIANTITTPIIFIIIIIIIIIITIVISTTLRIWQKACVRVLLWTNGICQLSATPHECLFNTLQCQFNIPQCLQVLYSETMWLRE
ncbi:unnamed protein product [Gadus morhua 'NCC']